MAPSDQDSSPKTEIVNSNGLPLPSFPGGVDPQAASLTSTSNTNTSPLASTSGISTMPSSSSGVDDRTTTTSPSPLGASSASSLASASSISSSFNPGLPSVATSQPESSRVPLSITDDVPTISATEKGLAAGLAIAGVLLLLMLTTIAILLRRKDHRDRSRGYAPFQNQPMDSSGTGLVSSISSPASAEQKVHDLSSSTLETTIVGLESQLHEKDVQLREHQAALFSLGRRESSSHISNKQVYEKFDKLNFAIQQWVMEYFGKGRSFIISPSSETIAILKRSQPGHEKLLKDLDATLLLLRGLVADVICQAITTGQLLGSEAYWELKQAIFTNSSAPESNEWRALTMRLLEKTSTYQSDRTESVDEVCEQIEHSVMDLTGSPVSLRRRADLVRVVDMAAKLALDTAKQRPLFKLQTPAGIFDSRTMEAVLVDDQRSECEGRPIRAVIFPFVSRWGTEKGSGYEDCEIVYKARVLI